MTLNHYPPNNDDPMIENFNPTFYGEGYWDNYLQFINYKVIILFIGLNFLRKKYAFCSRVSYIHMILMSICGKLKRV